MTEEEVDNIPFTAGDEVIVYKYFGTERQDVEYVNFNNRTVNGYKASEIKEYIKK